MASRNRGDKKKLSKSILDMKFMKKSKEKAYQDEEDEEGKAMFASEVTEAMRLGSGRFILEPSHVPCAGLIVGRLSYHGMNPEIERLLEVERGGVAVGVKKEEGVDVTDKEMAERYSSLVGTMEKKFQKGGAPPRKRTKFMKPQDD